jgi:ATP-binding protein involved in chromosome partitioning
MGPVSFRTYHQVEGDDRSALAQQVGEQRRRVHERLGQVRRVIAVMSGKGGVGKSYVTAALARGSASKLGGGIGVLDADLKGPTTARMLGAAGPLRIDPDGVHPAQVPEGIKVFSMGLLLEAGQPLRWKEPEGERFVWRGVLETGALREFLSDVAWGPLDLLLVDLPPGSDRLEDLAELVPQLSGAVVVTLPSEESFSSVQRSMRSARDRGISLLGVIENMSGYYCAGCGKTMPLFPGTAGVELAREFDVPLLATLPFWPSACPPATERPSGREEVPSGDRLSALTDAFLQVLP